MGADRPGRLVSWRTGMLQQYGGNPIPVGLVAVWFQSSKWPHPDQCVCVTLVVRSCSISWVSPFVADVQRRPTSLLIAFFRCSGSKARCQSLQPANPNAWASHKLFVYVDEEALNGLAHPSRTNNRRNSRNAVRTTSPLLEFISGQQCKLLYGDLPHIFIPTVTRGAFKSD